MGRMVRPLTVVLSCALTLVACRKAVPDPAPVSKGAPATLEILKGDRWLFTYAEPDGQFATTDKADVVPAISRGVVRVIDPSNASNKNTNGTEVYVADLNQILSTGKAAARALSREAFETAALAQLPAGASSVRADHPAGATPPPALPVGDAGVAPGTTPVVTVYGTSWCGACRAARQYLSEHKIPYADKDVEQDPLAARELAEKAGKLGIPTDRVPVIEVRGRLLLGFDRARIEALLGEAT
jgi:glutaredoxin